MSGKPSTEPVLRSGKVNDLEYVLNPPIARPDGLPIQVLIRGDAMHDPQAATLADDIRRLVETFLGHSSESHHKEVRVHKPHSSESRDDLHIVVHNLGLPREAQEQLIHQIKSHCQKRLAKARARS